LMPVVSNCHQWIMSIYHFFFWFMVFSRVCQWLAKGQWFSPCTEVSSTNKTDHHDITEMLLSVALNTITLTLVDYRNNKLLGFYASWL
jgi:hypothetical protein